jgi:hypothetical protein
LTRELCQTARDETRGRPWIATREGGISRGRGLPSLTSGQLVFARGLQADCFASPLDMILTVFFLISIDTKQDKETDGDALIMKYTSVLKYDIIDFLLQF